MCALAFVASRASAQQRTDTTRSGPAVDTLRLTRARAIATSLLANPLLEIASEQTRQVRAQRVTAVAIPDPLLTASLDGQPAFLRLGSATARNVNLGLIVPFPDKFRLRNAIGTANIQASESQFRLVQQLVAAQAARAYDSVLVTRLHRRDLTDARQLAADFLIKTQARFNAGTVARLDVIKAQVAVAQADNDLIANARFVANTEAALNRVLGRPLGLPIVPLDSLEATDALPDLDAVLRAALRARPELASIAAQQRAARANRALVVEQAFVPDFSLSANRDFAQDLGTLYSTGLSMPLAVFFWQHPRGDFAEARHRELELAASYRDIAAGVGQDVRAAHATADAAQRQVIFIRDQLLPSAREAYRVATVSYGLGGLSALDVLDARRTLVDAQRQYADALAAASSARSDLERAAGAPFPSFAPGVPRE